MQTSEQWWAEVKADESLLLDWLKKQAYGERAAVSRITEFRDKYATTEKQRRILSRIISDEEKHAEWVEELLRARGASPLTTHEERYWPKVADIVDFESGAAVGALAEQMRLERIRVIANDPEAPKDVRGVFKAIYKDEEYHASAFFMLAGDGPMAAAAPAHAQAVAALGLIL